MSKHKHIYAVSIAINVKIQGIVTTRSLRFGEAAILSAVVKEAEVYAQIIGANVMKRQPYVALSVTNKRYNPNKNDVILSRIVIKRLSLYRSSFIVLYISLIIVFYLPSIVYPYIISLVL